MILKRQAYGFLSLLLIIFFSCRQKESQKKLMTVEAFAIMQGIGFIEKFDVESNAYKKIDSFSYNNGNFKKGFSLNDTSNNLFRIRISKTLITIPFVFDNNQIALNIDFARPNNYVFNNSPLNISIKHILNSNNQQLIYSFADTVSNAAAFVLLYSHIDFQGNAAKQKGIIQKAASRFPIHNAIQKIHQEYLEYEKIMSKEFNVGDTMPSVILPDEKNMPYSTASLAGKPYLLFFWSTWCNQCNDYFTAISKAQQQPHISTVAIVNIAIDKELEDWRKKISEQNFTAKNLIDVKMWNGAAARTFCFDSIPFNFLVSSKGIILSKAIKPEHISDTLLKYFPKQ